MPPKISTALRSELSAASYIGARRLHRRGDRSTGRRRSRPVRRPRTWLAHRTRRTEERAASVGGPAGTSHDASSPQSEAAVYLSVPLLTSFSLTYGSVCACQLR